MWFFCCCYSFNLPDSNLFISQKYWNGVSLVWRLEVVSFFMHLQSRLFNNYRSNSKVPPLSCSLHSRPQSKTNKRESLVKWDKITFNSEGETFLLRRTLTKTFTVCYSICKPFFYPNICILFKSPHLVLSTSLILTHWKFYFYAISQSMFFGMTVMSCSFRERIGKTTKIKVHIS